MFVVGSTLPWIDANGEVGGMVALDPPTVNDENSENVSFCIEASLNIIPAYTISSMQLLACNIDARDSNISVSAQTLMPSDDPFPLTPPFVTWHNWTDPGIPTDPLLAAVHPSPYYQVVCH